MKRRKEGYFDFEHHPNAYLERKRNVEQGLHARTKILETLAMSTPTEAATAAVSNSDEMRENGTELTIKAISESAAMSYSSSFHHLRLLEEEKIVKREGKRPYKWVVTGKGQRSLDELDLGLGVTKMGKELLMIPGPVPVLPRIREAMTKPMIFHRGDEFGAMYEEIVETLKEIFQTRNDLFVLSGSGTCAMEAAIGNLVSNETKMVCIANGKFGERFGEIAVRYKADAVTPVNVNVNFEWGHSIELEAVKEALENSSSSSSDPKSKIVTMVHNETSTGILNPAKEVGKLARKHDAVFVLDCITSIGGDKVPVDELGADIAIVGSQKCMGAPPGLSALSVSEHAWDLICENERRLYYTDLIAYKKSLEKKQTPYTPALPLFFALHEALAVIREEGMENRIERHRGMAKAVRDAVTGFGLRLFPKLNEVSDYSNTVTAIEIPVANGITDEQLRGGMRKRGVIVAGGQEKLKGEIFRIATMGNITEREVMRTLDALEVVLEENNYYGKNSKI
uniref:2-aminoethylphosphonate--pyruvate transaminase n=1 Tax=Candidatus Methanophagaceae archaeon ANME-1 ERB6 TaxID=2759912 RepID=A0A7G9Z0X6_9EURY|nr:2-aminoethylphosphonate--pyruvate transaminase [Methanosarcinales archaeon ANME-1 ERB6]